MFWYFALAALAVWLPLLYFYSALRAEIDSALEKLRQKIIAEVETLSQKQEPADTENPEDDLDARVREQIYKDFPRYGIHDAYTVSELLRSYERVDSRARIRLLRRVYAQGVHLPYEVALKAVTDGDPMVREWMAKESPYLDYREPQYERAGEQFTTTYVHPDRDLVERLRQDSDPFIRAALRENSKVFRWGPLERDKWMEEFGNCAPLERLAMMRNKELDFELVNLILDVDDIELNLEREERLQLARACLVNERVVENSRRSRTRDFADGWGWYQAGKDAKTIWELAAKWPEDSGIQFLAFNNVQADDETKAHVYSRCQSDLIRRTILESCFPEDRETVSLGRADSDPTARFISYGRSRWMEKQEIEDALRREKDGTDKWLIDGLLKNPWLGSIARELNMALEDNQVQPISDGLSENTELATQVPLPRQSRENLVDSPTEDRVTDLFQAWQEGGKEGLREAYQKDEEN